MSWLSKKFKAATTVPKVIRNNPTVAAALAVVEAPVTGGASLAVLKDQDIRTKVVDAYYVASQAIGRVVPMVAQAGQAIKTANDLSKENKPSSAIQGVLSSNSNLLYILLGIVFLLLLWYFW